MNQGARSRPLPINHESAAARPLSVTKPGATNLFIAIAPVCSAVAAFSYFRTWATFEMGGQGLGAIEMSGLTLTREIRGAIPWQLIIPGLLIAALALSSVMFLARGARLNAPYGLLLIVLGVFVGLWPMAGVAQMSRRLFRLQAIGATSMSFTIWWWVYFASVLLIVVSGALQLLARRAND